MRGFQGQIYRCLWEVSGREEARGDQMDRIHERKVPSNIIMISVGQSGSRGKRRLPAEPALPRRAFLSYLLSALSLTPSLHQYPTWPPLQGLGFQGCPPIRLPYIAACISGDHFSKGQHPPDSPTAAFQAGMSKGNGCCVYNRHLPSTERLVRGQGRTESCPWPGSCLPQ